MILNEDISGMQNPDGGFPCRGKKGNPSCLNDTSVWIGRLIRNPNRKAKTALQRAFEWVLSTQSEEGAFIEPEEVASVPNIPPWVPPGKPSPLTPQLVAYLLRAGYGDRMETKKAVNYLLDYWQKPDGSFRSKYMIWTMIEVLIRAGFNEDSRKVKEAIEATRKYFEEYPNDPPALLWTLGTLKCVGFDKDHFLVKEVFNILMNTRNEDGGWSNECINGKIQKETDPVLTQEVLDTLRAYKLIQE